MSNEPNNSSNTERPRNLPEMGSKPHNSAKGGIGIIVICLVVAVGFFVLGMAPRTARDAKLKQRAKEDSSAEPQVPVMDLQRAPVGELSLPGTTEAIVDAVIQPRSAGYLSKRFVDIGDRVKAGQTLAIIESPDVDQQLYQAQAQESQSHALTQQAVADLANKQATVSQYHANVSQAQANVEQANAQVSDARAKLAQLIAAKGTAESQHEEAVHQIDIKQAALVQAETQSNLAEVTYKRYKTLLDGGFVSLQDVDQADAAFKTAVAAVNSAKADLNASKSAADAALQQVTSAQANIDSGKSQVTAAEKSVRAVSATVNSNAATVMAAQANVKLGQSNVSANLQSERANKFNTKRFAVLTGFEKVVAPFDGVITARNVDVGYLVGSTAGGGGGGGGSSQGAAPNVGTASGSGAPSNSASGSGLFGLARTDVIRILIAVPESYSRSIRTGQPAKITIREFPGKPFVGTVARLSGGIDTNSRTLLTEVHIDNRNGALLPGMFAQVHFELPNPLGQFRVPASSIIYDAQGTRVMAVDGNNKLHFVPVKIAKDYGQQIDISEGLSGSEQIVINPTDDLTDGETIKPKLTVPPAMPAAPGPTGTASPKGGAAGAPTGSTQSAMPGLGGPGGSNAQSNPTSQQAVPNQPGSPVAPGAMQSPQSQGSPSSGGHPGNNPSTPASSGAPKGQSVSGPGNGPVIQGSSSGGGSAPAGGASASGGSGSASGGTGGATGGGASGPGGH